MHTLINPPPPLHAGSSVPLQPKGRLSAQEDREGEEDEEDIAGNTDVKKQVWNHMTSHTTDLAEDKVADPQGEKLH